MILISHDQSSEASEPCESALDYISSPVGIPECVILSTDVSMILSMRQKKVDASLSELFPMGIAVIGLVSNHSFGPSPGSPRSFFRDLDVCEDFLEEPDLSRRVKYTHFY